MPPSIDKISTTAVAQRKSTFIRRATVRLGTVVIALALALVPGEILVRNFSPQNLSGQWFRTDHNGMSVHRQNHSARHQFGDRVVNYRLNGDGLRDLSQGDSEYRVLCVGDSFTFGWLLRDEDTFIAKLQEKADHEFGRGRFALLNGGHGGWGASAYVRFFEEYGSNLQLSGLIVFLNFDDIRRSLIQPQYDLTQEETLVPTAGAGVQEDGVLLGLLNSTLVYPWLLEHSHLLHLARNTAAAAITPEPLPRSPVATDRTKAKVFCRALFRRLKKLADDQSVQLIVLTTGFHDPPSPYMLNPNKVFMSTAAQAFAEDGIVFYDCTNDLRQELGNDYSSIQIVGDGHPNEAGAKLIAEANWTPLQKFLTKISQGSE